MNIESAFFDSVTEPIRHQGPDRNDPRSWHGIGGGATY